MARNKKRDKKRKKGDEKGESVEVHFKDRRSSTGARMKEGVEEESRPKEEVEIEEEEMVEEEKNAEILDQLKRLQAEFENYRKRVHRERLESWNVAKRDLILSLLPFIDDMQRVSEWEDEEIEIRTVLDGMKLTANKLMSILKEEGFERVDALGKPFDPNFHEALLIQEVGDREKDNLVDEVLVEGYLFKGILLRPARVKVLKFKGEDEEKGEEGIRDEAEDVSDGEDGYGEGGDEGGDNVDS